MNPTQSLNHNVAIGGWSALFIWWGISILVGPITIGMSAVGTGLILLGVNTVRRMEGIPTNPSNTVVGAIAIAWGLLDHVLALPFGPSLAVFLIVVGVTAMASLLARARAA